MEQRSSGGVLLFILAIFLGLYLTRDADRGRQAPDFSLPKMYGGRIDLASYRGRPVLLVFWMTSCGICRHELPLLNRMAPRFRSKGIDVVAVHLGGVDDARDYFRENHLDLTSVIDSDGDAARAYHVRGVPKMVLIGKDGVIQRTTAGMANEEVLDEWMDLVTS